MFLYFDDFVMFFILYENQMRMAIDMVCLPMRDLSRNTPQHSYAFLFGAVVDNVGVIVAVLAKQYRRSPWADLLVEVGVLQRY